MHYTVEKTDPHSLHPHLTDETYYCESATEAGRRMEDLCPVEAADITECLWRGEGPIRDVDERGVEVVVTEEPFVSSAPPSLATIAERLARVAKSGIRLPFMGMPDPSWPFRSWSVTARPFDWAEDESDLPAPDPVPPWELPERRQFNLYLRPAGAVVRR